MDFPRSVLVIVPAYNEGKVIKATVGSLLKAGLRVVVVDDGSTDETRNVRHLPVIYLRHMVNLGQGAALQTGMTYALRSGADIAVHFDADGQHDCAQIPGLIEPIVNGSSDVVFGSRFLLPEDSSCVPWNRRIALRRRHPDLLVDDRRPFVGYAQRLPRVLTTCAPIDPITGERLRARDGDPTAGSRSGLRYVERPITVTYTDYSRQKGQPLSGSFGILFDLIMAKLTR